MVLTVLKIYNSTTSLRGIITCLEALRRCGRPVSEKKPGFDVSLSYLYHQLTGDLSRGDRDKFDSFHQEDGGGFSSRARFTI